MNSFTCQWFRNGRARVPHSGDWRDKDISDVTRRRLVKVRFWGNDKYSCQRIICCNGQCLTGSVMSEQEQGR